MASKRPSAADTIYPPKKRALYEHMKLHGIDKFSTNHNARNGILGYQENLNVYGLRIPVNVDIRQSETFTRPRSDSLHSQQSSNSDHTETASTGSRETSPYTIQAMFDHHTPERNPIQSFDGLKSVVSKPLFPPSDSDNSIVGSDGHLSPDIPMYGEADETKAEESKCEMDVTKDVKAAHVCNEKALYPEKSSLVTERQADANQMIDHNTDAFRSNAKEVDSFQKESIAVLVHESMHSREHVKAGQQVNCGVADIYMGPMVSLLNRFNAEAIENSTSLKIKDQLVTGEIKIKNSGFPRINEQLVTGEIKHGVNQRTSVCENAFLNYRYEKQQPDSVQHTQGAIDPYFATLEGDFNPGEKIVCRICLKEFASSTYLHNHMKTHDNKSIPCWVCKEMFYNAENLSVHMKLEHKGVSPYRCEHCSREFSQYNNLRRHMRVHRDKVFKCNLCDREFNEEFYLKMHMGTHTGKRVYSCGVCGAAFPSSHNLKMHVKTHSPSLLHTCDVCGKSFSKACVLRQHKKGHSGERPHKCEKCEKTFIHRHHLTMHMKSHLEEKHLSCDLCKKEFTQHSHLYKHLRDHDEVSEYVGNLKSVPETGAGRNNVAQKDITVDDRLKVMKASKVALMGSGMSDESTAGSSEIHHVANVKSNAAKSRQRKRTKSQNSHYTTSLQPATDNQHLPTVAQTFGRQSSRYPSVPYVHGYQPGSHSAQPFPPLYSPLHRVPAPLQTIHPYDHMYRSYSQQVQYYNNMYMMSYLSQNALLQKVNGEGPKIPSVNNYLLQAQIENNKLDDLPEKQNNSLPKFVKDINMLHTEHVSSDVTGKVADEQLETDVENEENLDVVNESELGSESDRSEVDRKVERKYEWEDYANSEEHEIAQELLKMSAGHDVRRTVRNEINCEPMHPTGLESSSNHTIHGYKNNGNSNTHTINDIIEKTSRNTGSNVQGMENDNATNVHEKSVSNSRKHIHTSDSNSLQHQFWGNMWNNHGNIDSSVSARSDYSTPSKPENDEHAEKGLHVHVADYRETCHVTNKHGHVGIVPSPTSPLQKLQIFVASEQTHFNKVDSSVKTDRYDDDGHYGSRDNSNMNNHGDKVTAHFGATNLGATSKDVFIEMSGLGKSCNDVTVSVLKDTEGTYPSKVGIVKVLNAGDVDVEQEGLDNKLNKIRQCAYIGHMLEERRCVDKRDTAEKCDIETTVEDLMDSNAGMEDVVEKCIERNSSQNGDIHYMTENSNNDVTENSNNDVIMCDGSESNAEDADSKGDNTAAVYAGYFNDSLEDRQLEIVESESFLRGEALTDGGTVNGIEYSEGRHVDTHEVTTEYVDRFEKENVKEVEANSKNVENVADHYNTIIQKDKDNIASIQDQPVGIKGTRIKETELICPEENMSKESLCEINENGMNTVELPRVLEKENVTDNPRSDSAKCSVAGKSMEHVEDEANDSLRELKQENVMETTYGRTNSKIYVVGTSLENEAVDLRTERKRCASEVFGCKLTENEHILSRRIENQNVPIDLSLTGRKKYNSGGSVALACRLCWKMFDSVGHLERHQIEHARNVGNYCHLCNKSFSRSFEFQCHMLKHRDISLKVRNKSKIGTNIQLESVEMSETSLDERREIHEHGNNLKTSIQRSGENQERNDNMYICKFCDETFDQSEAWIAHSNTHKATEKPYSCNVCFRNFAHRHNLNRHKMSHNSKSYVCDICNRSFKESFYLQMHMKTHSTENNHKCEICGQNVPKSEIWKHTSQHLENISENPTYEQIGNRVQEILHRQTGSERKNTDNVVGNSHFAKITNVKGALGDFTNLTKHSEMELRVCEEKHKVLNLKTENIENCNATPEFKFESRSISESSCTPKSVLTERRQEDVCRNTSIGNGSYECHVCHDLLQSKHELGNHMGIHNGSRPYVCNTCGRAFKKSKGLRTHEKLHLHPSLLV